MNLLEAFIFSYMLVILHVKLFHGPLLAGGMGAGNIPHTERKRKGVGGGGGGVTATIPTDPRPDVTCAVAIPLSVHWHIILRLL